MLENCENLEFLLEEIFLNPQTIIENIREMNPCKSHLNRHENCPSSSGSESSGEFFFEEEKPKANEVKKPSAECFFVNSSSATNTRLDSIEKLETKLENLDEKIESIEDEKLNLKQEICMKRKKLQEAILKVIEFEKQIEEIEKLMETNLHRFQLRIISLENKLQSNFEGNFFSFFTLVFNIFHFSQSWQ